MGREIKRVPMDYVYKHTGDYERDAFPPEGPGWQLWQTVSDQPVSPVFATADELVDFMVTPVRPGELAGWAHGYSRRAAEALVRGGWAPSFVMDASGIRSGAEWLAEEEAKLPGVRS